MWAANPPDAIDFVRNTIIASETVPGDPTALSSSKRLCVAIEVATHECESAYETGSFTKEHLAHSQESENSLNQLLSFNHTAMSGIISAFHYWWMM